MSEDHEDIEGDEELDVDFEVDEVEDGAEARGRGIGFVVGVVFGIVLGAGVALLVAPQRGEVTRRRLRKRVRGMQEEARDKLGEWGEGARKEFRRQRRRLRRRVPS